MQNLIYNLNFKTHFPYLGYNDTNCKPVLIEQDIIDRWCVTQLIKADVYIYSLQQSLFKKVNFHQIFIFRYLYVLVGLRMAFS
jgi:hypothetical protein